MVHVAVVPEMVAVAQLGEPGPVRTQPTVPVRGKPEVAVTVAVKVSVPPADTGALSVTTVVVAGSARAGAPNPSTTSRAAARAAPRRVMTDGSRPRLWRCCPG